MRARRRGLAADNRRSLVDERIILEGLDHEECEVRAARDVAAAEIKRRAAESPTEE